MRISTRGRYGLRAMVDLAAHPGQGPLALREIAERQEISESYLEQVFATLRKAGLVSASRGPQGGYELARAAEEISVGDVLRALEGPLAPVHCVDPVPAARRCPRQRDCAVRDFWAEFRDRINQFLDGVSLRNLVERSGDTGGMYYI